MLTRRDQLKLDIMEALKAKPMTMFELAPHIMGALYRAPEIATVLDELVADRYLSTDEYSSTVGTLYQYANEHSLSDLRARLLPHRDPVREAHARDTEQGGPARYRRPTAQGADLGDDD